MGEFTLIASLPLILVFVVNLISAWLWTIIFSLFSGKRLKVISYMVVRGIIDLILLLVMKSSPGFLVSIIITIVLSIILSKNPAFIK